MSGTREIIDTITQSEAQTEGIAERFVRELGPSGIVRMHGDLGAGKTRFVRGIVRALGGDPRDVSSPTFAMVNEYVAGEQTIGHVDAYRLSGEDELETIGWDELVDRCDLVLVEWAERLPGLLESARYDVTLRHEGENARRIIITTREARDGRG